MRKLYYALLGLVVISALAYATVPFSPKGVTHSNLLGVLEQSSPTTNANDRPLLEFTNWDGTLCVVTFQSTDGTFHAINTVTGAACATSTTTTSTTSTSTSTSTTTTSTSTTTSTTA